MIRTHLTLQLTAFRWAECRWQQLRGSLYCEACRLLSTLTPTPHCQPPQASNRLAFTLCCTQFTARSLKCTRGEFNLLFNAILFSNQLKIVICILLFSIGGCGVLVLLCSNGQAANIMRWVTSGWWKHLSSINLQVIVL